jgi:hypothetical protein
MKRRHHVKESALLAAAASTTTSVASSQKKNVPTTTSTRTLEGDDSTNTATSSSTIIIEETATQRSKNTTMTSSTSSGGFLPSYPAGLQTRCTTTTIIMPLDLSLDQVIQDAIAAEQDPRGQIRKESSVSSGIGYNIYQSMEQPPPPSRHHHQLYTTTAPPATADLLDDTADADAMTTTIEIAPGVSRTLRGAVETTEAITAGYYVQLSCMICKANLRCVADCEMVLCPNCLVVSPNTHEYGPFGVLEAKQGVGLGVAVVE